MSFVSKMPLAGTCSCRALQSSVIALNKQTKKLEGCKGLWWLWQRCQLLGLLPVALISNLLDPWVEHSSLWTESDLHYLISVDPRTWYTVEKQHLSAEGVVGGWANCCACVLLAKAPHLSVCVCETKMINNYVVYLLKTRMRERIPERFKKG